jgi:hypothetical protein
MVPVNVMFPFPPSIHRPSCCEPLMVVLRILTEFALLTSRMPLLPALLMVIFSMMLFETPLPKRPFPAGLLMVKPDRMALEASVMASPVDDCRTGRLVLPFA